MDTNQKSARLSGTFLIILFGWVGVLSGILISPGVWLPRYDESLYSVFVILASPLGLWQLASGIWLIIKGTR
ncbi:MAG: hypothetical protein OEZ34_03585 [Spirochaetia bacterium]|nr:hypothetical protein [Spirochaetia bacterium]